MTVPPSRTGTGLQRTNRLVTSAPATVPVAGPPAFDPVTQSWRGRLGDDLTVTAYAAPEASGVGKVKLPTLPSVRSSPPLTCSTIVPPAEKTVPPML